MTSRHTPWIAAGVLTGAALFGVWLVAGEYLVPEMAPSKVAGGALTTAVTIGGPFHLVDDTGKEVSEADYRGRHMMIYFGYTYCPDACPTALQAMGAALEQLDPAMAAKVAPIFITVDPERDTVKTLHSYVPHFHDRLRGLTGTPEEIAKAARNYRVYYAKAPQSEGPYLMDHTSMIYLMGPDGRFVTVFRHTDSPDDIAKALKARLRG